MTEALTLAIIEDEEAHFSLMERSIAKALSKTSIYHFREAKSFLERIDTIKPTVIITDYLLPGMNGIEFLEVFYQKHIETPVIMVTGQGDENIAVQAMKLGAKDYLVKSGNFFTLLPSIIEKVVYEKKLRDDLRETEAKYRLVVENAHEGILVLQDGMINFSNPRMTILLGYAPEEQLSGFFHDFVHPEDRDIFTKQNSLRQTGTAPSNVYDFRIINESGSIRWLRNSEVSVHWENRPASLHFLTDITDQKKSNEQIQALRQKLMGYQENKRHMISRELHDSIAQDLSLLKIGWETLFDKPDITLDEVKQNVSAFSADLKDIINNVRELSYLLSPSGLEHLGLVQSISRYGEEVAEKTKLQVKVTSAGMDAITLDYNTKINLYRIAQEGINNIRQHADATQATIHIVSAYPNILLTIEDDGKGFDIHKQLDCVDDEKKMGLQSMRERALLLGGNMEIQSYPGQGTKITARIPFKEKRND
jgi:PAS domain S-box-containing protein